jgi:hypothetical protein
VQRPHDTITISLCGRLWINFQGREPRNGVERSNVVADFHAKNLSNIRSWIGADEQDALAIFSQMNRRGAGNGGFAHASLAGKEKKARRVQKKLHERRIALQIARKTIRSRSANSIRFADRTLTGRDEFLRDVGDGHNAAFKATA